MTITPATSALRRIDAYATRDIAGFPVRMGRPLPFGATAVPGGINFSVYSNNATAMTLVLFHKGEREPMAELPFPDCFRIGSVFAMTVFGLDVESIEYGYRAGRSTSPARTWSSTRHTCAGSPGTRRPGWSPRAPTPDSSRRSRT
jgi:isoamylase